MDIKEYIASGIIDNYVVGAVSDQERQEVQCLSKIYPEIAEELRSAQRTLEKFAEHIAVPPPIELKSKIMASIASTKQEKEVPIVPITGKKPNDKFGGRQLRLVAAAATILFIVSSLLYFSERTEVNTLNDRIAELNQQQEDQQSILQDKLASFEATMNAYNEREKWMTDIQTKELPMSGTAQQPGASAKAYWNAENKKLILSSVGLPTPDEGRQYQLWAIADGVPVDLGVLDKDSIITNTINVDLNNITAFAITLEKEGGAVSPTLEEMYVIVTI